MKDEVGNMSLELFKDIFKEYTPTSIKLNWRGEPLINKNLVKMVSYAKSKGVTDVSFNTNGLLVTKDILDGLVKAKLDWIIFSIDASNKDTYEKIRVGGNWETLIKNIILTWLTFLSHKDRPKIRIQLCPQPLNEDEIDEWKGMFFLYADKLRVGRLFDPQGKKGLKIEQPDSCTAPWQRLTISWKGDMYPCTSDFLCRVPLGNIKDTSIYEAWHSKYMRAIRYMLRYHSRKQFYLCENCTSYC